MSIKGISSLFMQNCGVRAQSADAVIAMLVLLLAFASNAQAADPFNSDRPGGSDHALVSRYQGSILYGFGGQNVGSASVVINEKSRAVLKSFEGKVSDRWYLAPKGITPLEVYRNYRKALEAAGFETLYACESAQCESAGVQPMIVELPRRAAWKTADSITRNIFNSGNQPGFHYYSGKRNGANGPTFVTVALVGGLPEKPIEGRVRQFIEILEPATIDLGKVTVDANAIRNSLQREGKIALYGITFDTNKAEVRENSSDQLAEMASVLKAAPAMKVFIVGHTDNQGEFAANSILSQKRADAVVAVLSTKYGIALPRMVARGIANLAPVATNDSEEGRARNRRVEMVVR
ncbi:OmpA family protein [Massilia forsythiae]|uniref:OmpA family protein n=1 Tax=Massilia forsythiae TaxID=2728020 RepID=A0A7Z2W0G5_9BURK|nr:OmpA family protein [Massilia forsythiae]QJE02821.1 OmpA family protein [Massilia forsythiae]